MAAHALPFSIRPATEGDAAAICEIYNPFIASSIISFEQAPVASTAMAERIRKIQSDYPWIVAEHDAKVIGYAYASRWRTRAAYDLSAETTVYVAPNLQGAGVGRALYVALLSELRTRGFHAAIGCISLPNDASVAFHEACGFVPVGVFPEVGRKFDRWVDVGFWQIIL